MAEESADTTELDAIPTFVAEVVAVQQNAPRMKRITVGGDDLARFVPKGPDQFLYLLLPPPGREELTVGTDFNWTAYREMPEEERPVGAYYTVRHHRPERNEIEDRKSTRLNSSHVKISYAVFCLKKKIRSTKHASGE